MLQEEFLKKESFYGVFDVPVLKLTSSLTFLSPSSNIPYMGWVELEFQITSSEDAITALILLESENFD